LPWRQEDLSQRGHAIESRVYAEDPENNFFPQAGPLLLYREPSGPGIRVDSGVEEGSEIGVNYDPLLAKLIAYGESRDAAIARARAALRSYPILGIRTNVGFLLRLLDHPAFRTNRVHTGLVDELIGELAPPDAAPPAAVAAAARAVSSATVLAKEAASTTDPWNTLAGWGR
jgi:acetyl-CoA/propionyl-CoA carboxylase biotin carboxyl carrier protein